MLEQTCPVGRTLELLEGKWTLLILNELFSGVKRFGELRRSLHPISKKILTERLRVLEERGVVKRTIYSEIPPHVEYQLTEHGQRLRTIFAAMKAWELTAESNSISS